MREYELMVIFHPELDNDGVNGNLQALRDRVSQLGELTQCDILGRRRLAYEVRRCSQGTFALLNFTAPPAALVELQRFMHVDLHDTLIRHLLVKDEKRGTRPPAQALPEEGEDLSQEERMARAAAERAALEEAAMAQLESEPETAPAAEEAAPAAAEADASE